jgi:hypothetical protein
MRVWSYRSSFLTSALAGGERSASRICRFTPGERAPGMHWIGSWVDPRAGLDGVEKRKFLTLPGLELRPLGRPARSQSLYRLRYLGSWYGGVAVAILNKQSRIVNRGDHHTWVLEGRAMAQAVSRWLPTAVARVRSQVKSCGIRGGQSGTGARFLRVLRFPLPILIPPTAPHSSIIRDWYNRPNSGRHTRWTRCWKGVTAIHHKM